MGKRLKGTWLTCRFQRTTTGGSGSTPVVTNDNSVVGPINRDSYRDGTHPLAGEASKFNQPITGILLSTETTTQFFRMVGRRLPMSFEVVFKITQYRYDGAGRSLTPAVSYSDPVLFSIPDNAEDYSFEIPVPSANQLVQIHTVTTKLPA